MLFELAGEEWPKFDFVGRPTKRLKDGEFRKPQPCGYLGHPQRRCFCQLPQIQRYRSKISGPLLDRIDLQAEVGPVAFKDWAGDAPPEEPSGAVAARVAAARRRQSERIGGRVNAELTSSELKRHVRLGSEEKALLETASSKLGLSARSLDRALRVARTIADLAGEPAVRRTHLAEALQYRTMDRGIP